MPTALPAERLEQLRLRDLDARRRARKRFTPRSPLTLRQWIEAYYRLETGAPFRLTDVPHMAELFDAYSDPYVEELTVMKCSQGGGTVGLILGAIGYHMDQEPRHMLAVIPSIDEAEKWSKKKLQGAIDGNPRMQGKIDERSRSSGGTMLEKAFPGGSLGIVGSNSGRGFRMITAGTVFSDDVDGWDTTAGKGHHDAGDQVVLIRRRTDRIPDRKLVWVSTPTLVGHRIHTLYERSERRGEFHVACPHCGARQVLRWGGPDTKYGIKWESETLPDPADGAPPYVPRPGEVVRGRTVHRPDTAYYLCAANGCAIEERDKVRIVREAMATEGGGYLAADGLPVRHGRPRTVGYRFTALTVILPGSEWPRLVREFLDAVDDPESLRVFWNTILGEPWEDRKLDVDPKALEARKSIYPAEVPDGVGILTAFVDVQGNRIELQVMGFGLKEESWVVSHQRIHGDPEQEYVWQTLEAIRTREWCTAAGGVMRIRVLGIDEGYLPRAVYAYVLGKEADGVYAVDGLGGKREAILRRVKDRNRWGVRPWKAAVDAFKTMLRRRLTILRPGPGYLHFCRPRAVAESEEGVVAVELGMDSEYFAQFAREELRTEFVGGAVRRRWVKTGPNEAIDLTVGCMEMLYTIPGIRDQLPALVERARQKAAAAPARPRRRMLSRGLF